MRQTPRGSAHKVYSDLLMRHSVLATISARARSLQILQSPRFGTRITFGPVKIGLRGELSIHENALRDSRYAESVPIFNFNVNLCGRATGCLPR
jgi:hypothetical protein